MVQYEHALRERFVRQPTKATMPDNSVQQNLPNHCVQALSRVVSRCQYSSQRESGQAYHSLPICIGDCSSDLHTQSIGIQKNALSTPCQILQPTHTVQSKNASLIFDYPEGNL